MIPATDLIIRVTQFPIPPNQTGIKVAWEGAVAPAMGNFSFTLVAGQQYRLVCVLSTLTDPAYQGLLIVALNVSSGASEINKAKLADFGLSSAAYNIFFEYGGTTPPNSPFDSITLCYSAPTISSGALQVNAYNLVALQKPYSETDPAKGPIGARGRNRCHLVIPPLADVVPASQEFQGWAIAQEFPSFKYDEADGCALAVATVNYVDGTLGTLSVNQGMTPSLEVIFSNSLAGYFRGQLNMSAIWPVDPINVGIDHNICSARTFDMGGLITHFYISYEMRDHGSDGRIISVYDMGRLDAMFPTPKFPFVQFVFASPARADEMVPGIAFLKNCNFLGASTTFPPTGDVTIEPYGAANAGDAFDEPAPIRATVISNRHVFATMTTATPYGPDICCVHAETLVSTKRGQIPIRELTARDHVWDCDRARWIKVGFVVRFDKPLRRYIAVECDDSSELLIQPGHPLRLNGAEVKPEELIELGRAEWRVLDKPEHIYTVCTEQRTFVRMGGVDVATWSDVAWTNFVTNDERGRRIEFSTQ